MKSKTYNDAFPRFNRIYKLPLNNKNKKLVCTVMCIMCATYLSFYINLHMAYPLTVQYFLTKTSLTF